jgi:23S rRNA (cytosine1962-C5)-methyltransferase
MPPSIILKSGRDKSVRNRHPWIYSGAVKEHARAAPGAIVEVRTNQDELLGFGFYNPNSRIICRVFEFCSEPRAFDQSYWLEKLRTALGLRRQFEPDQTNAYRLCHAEGDFLPGLIVDRYNDTLVVQILSKGIAELGEQIFDVLTELGFERIYLKNKEAADRHEDVNLENGWVRGAGNTEVEIQEYGHTFTVDIAGGQKTGFYLDQRENRRLLQELATGKEVLNAFSYSGGFSLYALAGGATSVTSVDSSKPAIDRCNSRVEEAGSADRHTGIVADCFEYLRSSDAEYDIIVLDPPAFARSPKAVQRAARGYKEINMNALRLLRPGGLLVTFSCSGVIDRDLFRKIVFGAAADAGSDARILYQLSQPFDHPINIFHPEGEYLKGLVLSV